ncbi:hypothetical protein KIPB_002436, partial [Kipferlia bialata]|eukprot:g2436.t1
MFASESEADNSMVIEKEGGTEKRSGHNCDDALGYYKLVLGEEMHTRYTVTSLLGHGTFSSVAKCKDKASNKMVAVKVIRNSEQMRAVADMEMKIIKNVQAASVDETHYHIVRLLDSFTHMQHLCMVFEYMHSDLRQLLRRTGSGVGLPLPVIRSYTYQMLLGLKALHHDGGYAHCDIKPDNMLITGDRLVVSDLGSCIQPSTTKPCGCELVSRYYRPPECLLGLPISTAIDIWSMATTVFELST